SVRDADASLGLARLDQLEADVIGSGQERKPGAIGHLRWPFLQLGTKPLKTRDVGVDILGVDGKMLEAEAGRSAAGAQRFAGASVGEGDQHAALLRTAAHEAVAEYARLVAEDFEAECYDPPIRGLARVGGLDVNVVDPERHEAPRSLRLIPFG